MKTGFYPKLAWEGIRKNRRLYVPYLLACTGMVMMNYIVRFLSETPALAALPGAAVIATMLDFGGNILVLFSALFLFYTNSFLFRRRKKEFGLYNILGMDKRGIGRILFWETVIAATGSLVCGIALGIALSKLFELGLVDLVAGEVDYTFTVSAAGIGKTALTFAVIFLLLFFKGLRQVSVSDPVALLRSESTGEKPPRANWLLGAAGLALLAAAYYLAVNVADPISALAWFFAAVGMVIVATYLLFGAASVALCRLLQRNKGYYYRADHFVSVSSMAYRMKRNGAGLASICILLTMVLVMLSATAALYFGVEDSLRSRYPRDITVDMTVPQAEDIRQDRVEKLRGAVETVLQEYGAVPKNGYDYRVAGMVGQLSDGRFRLGSDAADGGIEALTQAVQLYIVPLDDYNRFAAQPQTLEPDEVLIPSNQTGGIPPILQLEDEEPRRVRTGEVDFPFHGDADLLLPALFVFVPDFDEAVLPLQSRVGDGTIYTVGWHLGIDLDLDPQEQIALFTRIRGIDWHQAVGDEDWRFSGNIECREVNRRDFYTINGGLFFLGVVLGMVFLAAAVLIIYYKQISEGYEDQARFEIMQKVGMTRRDIRRSINSQMRTVFFLPLLTAGVHMCFAFPMVRKMLRLFHLCNTALFVTTTVMCFLVFGAFYTLVYRLTSNAYFSIVSGARGSQS